jgi:hypothetical protein
MNNAALEKEVKRLVHSNRDEKGYVCSIDVLIQLGYLSQGNYEDWRLGRVEYLEKVCKTNLGKLTFINRLIRTYAIELNLKSSWTAYDQFGKGIKRRLRFSKSGDKKIEDNYSTHYVDVVRVTELRENNPSIRKA